MATFPELVAALRRGDPDADTKWLEFFEPTIKFHVDAFYRKLKASRGFTRGSRTDYKDDLLQEARLSCVNTARSIASGAHKDKPPAWPGYTGDYTDVVTQTLVERNLEYRLRDLHYQEANGHTRKKIATGEPDAVVSFKTNRKALHDEADNVQFHRGSTWLTDFVNLWQSVAETDAERAVIAKMARGEDLARRDQRVLRPLFHRFYERCVEVGAWNWAERVPIEYRTPKQKPNPLANALEPTPSVGSITLPTPTADVRDVDAVPTLAT